MYFIGVSTGQSASRKIFPIWMDILGVQNAQLLGIDLPLQTSVDRYRQVVAQIKQRPDIMGALITSHKVDLFKAAGDFFDHITEVAERAEEVSCIYKRDEQLIAHAVDPQACGLAMKHFLGKSYWRKQSADLMCIGAGGAARALAIYFCQLEHRDNQPGRLIFIDKAQNRLDDLKRISARFSNPSSDTEFIKSKSTHYNDQIMSELKDGSLVVNATGMGKDLPGSPLTDQAQFPLNGWAWDLNYRGKLDFLRQAQARVESRGLRVMDGWDYFLIGWAMVVEFVYKRVISPEEFAALHEEAEKIRSRILDG